MSNDIPQKESKQTPFDALGLTQKDGPFKDGLRALYNDVAESNDDWNTLVEQLPLREQPYLNGYIKRGVPVREITNSSMWKPTKKRIMRILDDLRNIWETSQSDDQTPTSSASRPTQRRTRSPV